MGLFSRLWSRTSPRPPAELYRLAGGPFAREHDRLLEEAIDFTALSSGELSADTRAAGLRSWTGRFLDEYRSLLGFSELVSDLAEARAPLDVTATALRIVRDELRHVELCRSMIHALGGWPDAAPEPTWVRSDRTRPARRRVLETIVGSCCVGETLSVAFIAGARENATHPVARVVLDQLLRDEAIHSRFGWWWLELESPTLSDDERRFLRGFVPRTLAYAAKTMRPRPARLGRNASFRRGPLGSLSPEERESIFQRALAENVLPGFARLGIDVLREGASS